MNQIPSFQTLFRRSIKYLWVNFLFHPFNRNHSAQCPAIEELSLIMVSSTPPPIPPHPMLPSRPRSSGATSSISTASLLLPSFSVGSTLATLSPLCRLPICWITASRGCYVVTLSLVHDTIFSSQSDPSEQPGSTAFLVRFLIVGGSAGCSWFPHQPILWG